MSDVNRAAAALASVGSHQGPTRLDVRPLGHAATFTALHEAHERIVAGSCSLAVIGGVDSYLDVATLDWLVRNRQLLSEDVRSGFVPGEAAGFVALMSASAAREVGASVLGIVSAVSGALERHRIKTDEVCLGEGLTEAIEIVLGEGPPDELVDEIYCDINGERYRSEEWGFVALRLGAAFQDASAFKTAVGSWGDIGAATGALNLVLTVQSFVRRYARGRRSLIWGSSEGGLRGAALVMDPAR